MHPQAALCSLDRVIAKYRRDVHQLPTGATTDALTALEGHLCLPLPRGLKDFLGRHNGAHLFRGALRIRCTSDMAIASHDAPQVVLFADGVEGTPPWGWAVDEKGRYVFGLWDAEQLEPMHSTFEGWFCATLSLLETRVSRKEDQESLRYFFVENDLAHRIDVCDKCKRYIKTIDSRKTDNVMNLFVENLSTLALDIVANKEEFRGGGVALFREK